MAWASHIGKDMTATFGVLSIPGIRRITISEEAPPLPEPQDITKATDSAYAYDDDPLGAKGSEKTSVTIDFQMSKTDYADSGLTSVAMNTSGEMVIDPAGATATYNRFTATLEFNGLSGVIEVRNIVTGTARFSAETAAVWSAVPS